MGMDNIFMHDAVPTWSGFLYQGRIAVYMDGNNKTYHSIHQVKNEKGCKLTSYKDPLIQLMLEKGFCTGCLLIGRRLSIMNIKPLP